MTELKQAAPSIITQSSGLSIALVIILVGGIASNVAMMFTLKNEVALVRKDVEIIGDHTSAIHSQVGTLTNETRMDIRTLRDDLTTLRVKMTKIEAKINGR